MEAKLREEVNKEVDEEFEKYLKEKRANKTPEKKPFNWYMALGITIMLLSIISIVCSLIPLFNK